MREFDLNIERVLENWTVAHALRGARDVSFEFEQQVTEELGRVMARNLVQSGGGFDLAGRV